MRLNFDKKKFYRQLKAGFVIIGGFVLIVIYIEVSQKREFEHLKAHGWYTIAIGGKTSKERTGWSFDYKYKVNDEYYSQTINLGSPNPELREGNIYFVVFDPYKIKRGYLLRTPFFPANFNLDSIPKKGWKELPVPFEKDSITNFLNRSYF